MLKGVSLFANVGVAETYLKDNNIDIILANELIEKRGKFYKDLYPNTKMFIGSIVDNFLFQSLLDEAIREECHFLMATPPCQGMSVAGKMKEDDPRNNLIVYAVKFAKKLQPKYFLIENVPAMLKTYIIVNNQKIKIIDYIKKELSEYYINYDVLDTADYQVPQTRKRVIILLSKEKKWEFPKKSEHITVREVISHLPSLESEEKSEIKWHYAKKHNDNHILWMRHTKTGNTALDNEIYFPQKDGRKIKGYSTTYKRIEWDKPSPTITMCNGAISSQNNVHPGRKKEVGIYSDARVLTLLEIFILSSLPKDWNVPLWATENLIREVIGEGVPPKFIRKLTENLV